MNFDDLKDKWREQELISEELTEKVVVRHINTLPLDKMRRNVIRDIWLQSLCVILLGFLPYYHPIIEGNIVLYYILFTLFSLVTLYYLLKMFLFYRKSESYVLNSYDSLYEVYFNVRMYVQLYENFCFSLAPFIILFIPFFIGLDLEGIEKLFNNIVFLVALFIYSLLVILFCKYLIYRFYGRYLKQLKDVLEEFKEEIIG
ncbi:hypothetical protein [Myroides phaeus]|uniref:Uncharacterized protein n=1 Tax=Myroides phaeus TaxID=702745 RepID=A0A1G8GS44_9FLAO|nr:hypothetical protein [Myroides phaeus]SDH97091.1 hypothetical protein SAMN05421818_13129 [Myroides phaeus]